MITDFFNRFRKSDDDQLAEATKLVTLLKDSPEVEALVAAQEERRLAKQHESLLRLDTLQKEKAATMPRLEAAVIDATEAEEIARQAQRVASERKSNAEHARLSASLDFSFKLGVLEGKINNSAPAEIDAFIWEMHKADEKARNAVRAEHRLGPRARILGTVTAMIFESNKDAVEAHREYIQNAINEAQRMKRQALSHGEIVHHLNELKKGLLKFKLDWFENVKLPLPDVSELRRNN